MRTNNFSKSGLIPASLFDSSASNVRSRASYVRRSDPAKKLKVS